MSPKELEELKKYAKKCEDNLKPINCEKEHSAKQKKDEKRSPSDIDYARILYSSYFRRLQGKM